MNLDEMLKMDRRGLMARAMALVGATAVAGHGFVAGAATPEALAPDRFKVLEAYADTLIPVTDTPGALAAGVPKVLAQMYRDWASVKTRELLAGAIDRIDAGAVKATGKRFVALTPAERLTFLKVYDKDALAPAAPPPDSAYGRLKDLVATLFYNSEIGLSQELTYEQVPGKWIPSIKVTPETRPAFGGF